MHINKKLIKKLTKIFITLIAFECIYLFALPIGIKTLLNTALIKNYIFQKTNFKIEYQNANVKTNILPFILIKADTFIISDKNTNSTFFQTNNANVSLKIFPLILKQINFNTVNADNIVLNLEKDEQGIFNFEKLFPKNKNKTFKVKVKNFDGFINKLSVNLNDKELNKTASCEINSFKINKTKNEINTKFSGKISANNQIASDLDVDLQFDFPFKKTYKADMLSGSILAYNIDLGLIEPFIKKYVDKNTKKLNGNIEYIQFSSEIDENNKNKITINTTFKDIEYDRNEWQNHIIGNGVTKLNSNIELFDNEIKINNAKLTANNVNVKSDGTIKLNKTPDLNLNIEILNTKAENLIKLCPPNMFKQTMIMEKIKNYGIFGDVNAKIGVNGKPPAPDITGFAYGKNLHILYDKSIQKLHKGSVKIIMNKRTLDMDILMDMPDQQNVHVFGNVYMFREGTNHVIVKSTDNIDFPLAQKLTVPISKVFNFQLGPIPEMDITKGKGKIDLDIKGSPTLIDIKGFSKFNNAQLSYNGIFGEAKNIFGEVNFDKDVVSFKTQKAYIKQNPFNINGKVKINDHLNCNISTSVAEAKDVMEIINNSELLKEVKDGLVVIKNATGSVRLTVDIGAKITPVPFGEPPLPPEEAFTNLRTKGSVYLLGNSFYLDGFYTPFVKSKGIVDFTEEKIDIHEIIGNSGTSPLKVTGKILLDEETKIPDVDIIVTAKEVNIKDTIKFLTESYLYPKEYPNLSSLYELTPKHDLYFTYKAKSLDFVTDKAYAIMNFLPDNSNNELKAKSGTITMKNSKVIIDNVLLTLFNSPISIIGNVENIDTVNPLYNLKINADNFNIGNLNVSEKLNFIPDNIKNIIAQFTNYQGNAKLQFNINKNKLNGEIAINNLSVKHSNSKIPIMADNFNVHINNDKLFINNFTANSDDIPLYGNLSISNILTNPYLSGSFTSKITDNFVNNYLPNEYANKIKIKGDVNLSVNFNGNINNLNVQPKLTLNPDSDIYYEQTNIGEITEKREFDCDVNITNGNEINIKKFNFIKYITSQNNKTYPMTFATVNGILKKNTQSMFIPKNLHIKTNKSLSAKFLNIFLKQPFFTQGTLNCDIKISSDETNEITKLIGNINCRNLNIPLFDTIVKNIEISGNNEEIDVKLFGFIGNSKAKIKSVLSNNITGKPKIKLLEMYADEIDSNLMLRNFTKTHIAMNKNNSLKNLDLSGLSIENGILNIKKLKIKELVANDFISNFKITKDGIFTAKNIKLNVGNGSVNGNFNYDLNDTAFGGNFKLNNVDSNYMAEVLFEAKNQIYGNANGNIILNTKGTTYEEMIKNLNGKVFFDVIDGRMPKLGSLEYLLRTSNIIKSGITSFSLNNILEILNLVKTGYFTDINGYCKIENGIANDIEIFSQGENLSMYIHGTYDINRTYANLEILGNLSKRIFTVFGSIGNASLNTFFKLIPGISLLEADKKTLVENVEKIPEFTNGNYASRTFQSIIDGNINDSGYVKSFKWVN